MTDRAAAEALVPEQVSQEVIKAVTQESAALQLCRNARMSSKVFRQPVLSTLPVAYWVEGEPGLKQTTAAAWKGVELIAEEIASILPIPQAVVDDSGYPIWDEVRPAMAESVAQKLDAAVFAGDEKPGSWPEAIIPAAIDAGNEVPFQVRPAGAATPPVETEGCQHCARGSLHRAASDGEPAPRLAHDRGRKSTRRPCPYLLRRLPGARGVGEHRYSTDDRVASLPRLAFILGRVLQLRFESIKPSSDPRADSEGHVRKSVFPEADPGRSVSAGRAGGSAPAFGSHPGP
jgi:hypothetical protein